MTGADLEERLTRLADGHVRATVPVPEELWARGRR